MRQGLLAGLRGRAALQGVEGREADIGYEMIGRRRKARPGHPLGHDSGGADELGPSIGQVLFSISAVELRDVLRGRIENEKMCCHEIVLSFLGSVNERYMGR